MFVFVVHGYDLGNMVEYESLYDLGNVVVFDVLSGQQWNQQQHQQLSPP